MWEVFLKKGKADSEESALHIKQSVLCSFGGD